MFEAVSRKRRTEQPGARTTTDGGRSGRHLSVSGQGFGSKRIAPNLPQDEPTATGVPTCGTAMKAPPRGHSVRKPGTPVDAQGRSHLDSRLPDAPPPMTGMCPNFQPRAFPASFIIPRNLGAVLR